MLMKAEISLLPQLLGKCRIAHLYHAFYVDREYLALYNGAVLPRLEQQHGHICVPNRLSVEG